MAERILCDTSFVGWSAKRATDPGRFAHWPVPVVERVERAILAISVVTLAEARYGYRNANWGQVRIEREEQRLASFLRVPLDEAILDEWARLRDLSERSGWNITDNDLWIAATASTRGASNAGAKSGAISSAIRPLHSAHWTVLVGSRASCAQDSSP
ncbi:MAG: type II toxin-antitoxin system VapC family toxin [Solirubrobacteraceae bacterium]